MATTGLFLIIFVLFKQFYPNEKLVELDYKLHVDKHLNMVLHIEMDKHCLLDGLLK